MSENHKRKEYTEDLIKKVIEAMKKKYNEDSFFQIYSFSNENIKGYLKHFDVKGKSIYTVGSSFDLPIVLSANGCLDIRVVDICPLTSAFKNLKLSALYSLDRNEFLAFFTRYITSSKFLVYGKDNRDLLSRDIFEKLKDTLHSLDYDSYQIWDEVTCYDYNDRLKLFRSDILPTYYIVNNIPYLRCNEEYERAREAIKKSSIEINNADIKGFAFDNSDAIFLSNLRQYIGEADWLRLLKNAKRSLNPGGKIMADYQWNSLVHNPEAIKVGDIILQEIYIGRATAPSFVQYDHNRDKVLIYKNVSR